jgi:hypothetical protein
MFSSLDPVEMISLKKLLVASVEMAKLGGLEVKGVRQQVSDLFILGLE